MLYKNKKKGTLYKVLGVAINCTNAQDGQEMLIYEPVEKNENGITFVREKKEFFEKFDPVEEKH